MHAAIRQKTILLEVAVYGGMAPFVFGVNGRVTAAILCELDQEIADDVAGVLDRGPGDYLIEARHFDGERDQEGGWILAPGWEFDVLSFSDERETLRDAGGEE